MEIEHKLRDSTHRFNVKKKDFFTAEFPYYGLDRRIACIGKGSLSYLNTWSIERDEYKETYKCVKCPMCDETIKVKREKSEKVGTHALTAEYSN